MFNWYKELLNIRYEFRERTETLYRESKSCKSCEILKHQLEVVYYEKKRLLDTILDKPAPESVREPMISLPSKNIPWAVKRQMLESEDREKAKLLREAPKVNQTPLTTEELERDLDIASAEREAKTS